MWHQGALLRTTSPCQDSRRADTKQLSLEALESVGFRLSAWHVSITHGMDRSPMTETARGS